MARRKDNRYLLPWSRQQSGFIRQGHTEVNQMTQGYNPYFIDGIHIPLPDPAKFSSSLKKSVLKKPVTLRDDFYSNHIHFTLVMNKDTRQLIYSACNIDQDQFIKKVPGEGKKAWKKVDTVGKENQLGNEYYKDRTVNGETIPNPYDRGHMVMRFNNMWDSTKTAVDKAGKATFIYPNSTLQHENLNRDEWKAIELDIVREFQDDTNNKLSLFTGPIYGDLDRHINLSDSDSARVPSGFFKIICYHRKNVPKDEKLGVLAFAVFQDDEVLRDKKGGKTIKTNREYQVTVSDIQDWTGIKFDKQLFNANPLFYFDKEIRRQENNVSSFPERIPVLGTETIVSHSDQRRCEILHLKERHIVINSAMINPKGNETRGEWVSLHNRGNRKTNIDCWRLVDGQGREATLSGSISVGESTVFKGRAKGKIKLANTGGSLMLFDKHGCVIDHVTWSKSQLNRIEEGTAFLFDRGN